MTFDYFDAWCVVYSQFVGATSESDISFVLSNDPEGQDSCRVGIITAEMSQGLMARVTLRDLDPGATVYGF